MLLVAMTPFAIAAPERAWGLALPRRVEQQAKLGDGRFVHAPGRGQRVRAESVDNPYWAVRFNGARRLAPPM